MGKQVKNEYFPDTVTQPGETLLETIQAVGMSQRELAQRMGRPPKTINEIVKGKAAITPETALQLERVLRVPASFWQNRERNYRDWLARKEEEKRLKAHIEWPELFPVAAMARWGFIEKRHEASEQVQELLSFFGVASPDAWQSFWQSRLLAFRKSEALQANYQALAAWLRMAEQMAQEEECQPFEEKRFKQRLQEVRGLTREPPESFVPKLESLCVKSGVVVVLLPELPKTRVFGATQWLSPTKAIIQLSLRYKTDDHLWFTFFHEAAHILLHGKREIFVETGIDHQNKEKEEEADRFAADFLIPPVEYRKFVSLGEFSRAKILEFADEMGIAPGIVVGRLQHDGHVPYKSVLNRLKTRFEWKIEPSDKKGARD